MWWRRRRSRLQSNLSWNCYPFTESSRLIYFDYQIRFIHSHKNSSFARLLFLSQHSVHLSRRISRCWMDEWDDDDGRLRWSTLSLRIAHYLFQLDVGLFNGTNPISKARKNDSTHTVLLPPCWSSNVLMLLLGAFLVLSSIPTHPSPLFQSFCLCVQECWVVCSGRWSHRIWLYWSNHFYDVPTGEFINSTRTEDVLSGDEMCGHLSALVTIRRTRLNPPLNCREFCYSVEIYNTQ